MRTKNEVKAGVVIFIALVIVIVGVFLVADLGTIWRGMRKIYIVFEDVGGLKINDPVYACGVKVGRVKNIKFISTRGEDGLDHTRALVEATITDDLVIREGYSVTVDKTLTAITSITIAPGSGKSIVVSRHQPLIGHPPANISNVAATLSNQVAELGQQLREKIKVLGEQINNLLGEVSRLVGDVRRIVSDPALHENLPIMVERIRQATEDIKEVTSSAKLVIEENREAVKAAIASIRDGAQNFNATLTENKEKISSIFTKLDKTSDTLDATLTKLGEAGEKATALVSDNRENIRKIVESLKQTTQIAKTTVEMVKRQPWRLLYKPPPSKLETANLYDSAFAFNAGAAEVNEAAATLMLLLSRQDVRVDAAQVQQVIQRLDASLAKYEEAEKEFWRCLSSAYQR